MTNKEAIEILTDIRVHYIYKKNHHEAVVKGMEALDNNDPVTPIKECKNTHCETLCGHCQSEIALWNNYCPMCGYEIDWSSGE